MPPLIGRYEIPNEFMSLATNALAEVTKPFPLTVRTLKVPTSGFTVFKVRFIVPPEPEPVTSPR